MADHTPGPWHACKDGNCPCGMIWGPDESCWLALVYGPSHLSDGITGPDHVPGGVAQVANARLISAAPDLLAACEAALAWFDEWDCVTGISSENERAALSAAIRKATGEEQ